MKEMIQARKEQLQARGITGFTLMEMLIVVAIIAVLIAIAIPVFTAQMNKSKEAVDEANARSIYAVVAADYMTNNNANSPDLVKPVTLSTEGDVICSGTKYHFNLIGTDPSFSYTAGNSTTMPKVYVKSNDHEYTFGG